VNLYSFGSESKVLLGEVTKRNHNERSYDFCDSGIDKKLLHKKLDEHIIETNAGHN